MLANLYLHYAFDSWMDRHYPDVPFERYADDIVCHCRSQRESETLLLALQKRMAECHLQLHPVKTRIVYCKDGKRRKDYPNTCFDFLGFSFHARTVQDRKGGLFTGFNPGISRKAMKRMNQSLKQAKLHRHTTRTLAEIAAFINPMMRGWVNYYGAFYPEPLKRFLIRVDLRLGKWARKKYKRLRGHKRRSWRWLRQYRHSQPGLFIHWEFVYGNGDG